MAYEDFTTYDETEEGTNVTVISSKVSWIQMSRNHTAHVSDSKGANYFAGDFEHLFECQWSNEILFPFVNFWALANSQIDQKAIEVASQDAATFQFNYNGDGLRIIVYESGSAQIDEFPSSTSGVTYYITLARDDDGGANNTGQYTVEIRTGSHTGVLVDTLTVDCSVGEQNDFEYIFGLMSYDDSQSNDFIDGFTQNLDLQISDAGYPGFMTPNTGYWGPTL